ncbi:hypothetical protein JKF63_00159 [Porcisia hertigi]|uniref:Uncharacterized protein n=1 Tax=Porcisia hertigi TaxID=2761500 RepID=A0A836L0U2_9TRYP|nr:hypothetical protein JKF63_00159 [Porcisia hertigi]
MSFSAVAASRPRERSPANRKGASSRPLSDNRTPNVQGRGSLHAAVAASPSSRRPPEMPGAALASPSSPPGTRPRPKGVPDPSQKGARAAPTQSLRSRKVRSPAGRRNGTPAAGLRSARRHRASSTMPTAVSRSPRSLRAVRRLSKEVALNRLQRAARWFLLHRYLREVIPVESPTPGMCDHVKDDNLDAEAAPQFETRFLHRLRAELYREKRVEELRARAAKRVIQTALRGWVQMRWSRDQRLSLQSRVLLAREHCPHRGAELDAHLCSIQASLRMCESSRLAEVRRVKSSQRAAVHVLERAWQRAPKYAASIRQINDRNMREMLCRHEAVERRDLLRLHLVFMVRCHQAFFNDPAIWDSGLLIRRIPLFQQCGFLPAESPRASPEAGSPSAQRTSNLGHSGTLCSDAAVQGRETGASALQPRTSPSFATATTVMENIRGWGSPIPGDPNLLVKDSDSCRAGDGEDEGRFGIDASLRLIEFYLLFSAEERQLLSEAAGFSSLQGASPVLICAAAERRMAHGAARPSKAEAEARLLFAHQVQVVPTESMGSDAYSLSYSKAFAAALTYLRQPSSVDASGHCAAQHLHNIRNSTLAMVRELHTHGYLSAPLVAPLLTFGLHYQGVARGDADLSLFTTTVGMKACIPMPAGRVTCASAELHRCFVGAVQDRRAAAHSLLPVVLEEHKCHLEAAARTRSQRPSQGDAPLFTPSLLPRTPAARFMREGFANASTEALYSPPGNLKQRSSFPDPMPAESYTRLQQGIPASIAYAAERSLRLATGADEVGSYWSQFIQSMRVDAFLTVGAEQGDMRLGANAASDTDNLSLSPSATMRVRRRLQSHLLPGTSSYLLQDFTSSGMRKNQVTSAVIRFRNAAVGASDLANGSPGITPSTSLSVPTRTSLSPKEWWNAVERLLLQEYADRADVLISEGVYRRSVSVLRGLVHPSAREPVPTR